MNLCKKKHQFNDMNNSSDSEEVPIKKSRDLSETREHLVKKKKPMTKELIHLKPFFGSTFKPADCATRRTSKTNTNNNSIN